MKTISCFFVLAILLADTADSFANGLLARPFAEESPILAQKAVFKATFQVPSSALGDALASVGERLAQKSIYWFGYPWAKINELGVICSGDDCRVQVVFTAHDFAKKSEILEELDGFGVTMLSFVTNEQGTFAGISGVLYGPENAAYICQPKVLAPVALWRESLDIYAATTGAFQDLAKKEKLKWVQTNFDCDYDSSTNLEELTSVTFHIDLTNATSCPMTAETLDTCFIGRGILDTRVPL
jgi:hypothetical protein